MVAIRSHLNDIGIPFGPGLGQPHVLDPAIVAIVPVRGRDDAQPVRCHRGDRVQRRAQGLGEQFDPVELAHRREHVRAVRALPPTRLEQSTLARAVKHASEQALGCPVLAQPVAKPAEHGVIKACIVQSKTEQIFPVDPGPHRLGRLTVTQPFPELEQLTRASRQGAYAG